MAHGSRVMAHDQGGGPASSAMSINNRLIKRWLTNEQNNAINYHNNPNEKQSETIESNSIPFTTIQYCPMKAFPRALEIIKIKTCRFLDSESFNLLVNKNVRAELVGLPVALILWVKMYFSTTLDPKSNFLPTAVSSPLLFATHHIGTNRKWVDHPAYMYFIQGAPGHEGSDTKIKFDRSPGLGPTVSEHRCVFACDGIRFALFFELIALID